MASLTMGDSVAESCDGTEVSVAETSAEGVLAIQGQQEKYLLKWAEECWENWWAKAIPLPALLHTRAENGIRRITAAMLYR